MVSRENAVIVVCIAAALVTLFAVSRTGDRPAWVGGVILLGIGVVVPVAINGYLGRRAG
ncbi:MAG: hypothetical protein ABEI75_04725 [Halobaculum sp.]